MRPVFVSPSASHLASKVLFDYCPSIYLDPEYRKQLVVAELRRYNPDVACLQEVDERAFHEFLLPHMRAMGFEGRYTNKMGKVGLCDRPKPFFSVK